MIRTRFSRLGYVDTRLDAETNAIEMTVVAHGSSFLSMTVEETKTFINVLYRLVKAAGDTSEPATPWDLEPINKLHPDDATMAAQAPRASPRWPVNEIPLPLRPAGIGKSETPRKYAYTEDTCPTKHWNDGTDTCADCGADLNPPLSLDDPQHPSNRGFDGPTGAE